MSITVSKLLHDIEQCRERMIDLAISTSYTNPRVVELSKELDDLLNHYSLVKGKK